MLSSSTKKQILPLLCAINGRTVVVPQPIQSFLSVKAARAVKSKIVSRGYSSIHLQEPQSKTGQMSWLRLFTKAVVELGPIKLIVTIWPCKSQALSTTWCGVNPFPWLQCWCCSASAPPHPSFSSSESEDLDKSLYSEKLIYHWYIAAIKMHIKQHLI